MFQWDNKEHTSFTGSFRDPETNTYKKITFDSKDTNPYIASVFGRHSYFEANKNLIECDLTKYSEQEQMEYLLSLLKKNLNSLLTDGVTYIDNDIYPINIEFLTELNAKVISNDPIVLGVTGHEHKLTMDQIKYLIKCITYVRNIIYKNYYNCIKTLYELPRELRSGVTLGAATFNTPVYVFKRVI